MKIIVADMGHGDCVGILQPKKALLVDLGASSVRTHAKEAQEVKHMMDSNDEKKLIITHYHWDHYNLLNQFPPKYFDESYLPALPPKTVVGQAILETLALFIVMRYRHYPLIPEIFRTAKKIQPLIRGDTFTAIDLRWEVIWPDYESLDKIRWVQNKTRNLRKKISQIREELSEPQRGFFEEIYGYLSRSLAPEELSRYEGLTEGIQGMRRYEFYGRLEGQERQRLEEIERDFKEIANHASLIVRNYLFLFTGDAVNNILNHVKLNDQPYFFVKASHHGTCYGNGLSKLSTEILTISRDERSKISEGYFYNVKWKILIDTARHGSCSFFV